MFNVVREIKTLQAEAGTIFRAGLVALFCLASPVVGDTQAQQPDDDCLDMVLRPVDAYVHPRETIDACTRYLAITGTSASDRSHAHMLRAIAYSSLAGSQFRELRFASDPRSVSRQDIHPGALGAATSDWSASAELLEEPDQTWWFLAATYYERGGVGECQGVYAFSHVLTGEDQFWQARRARARAYVRLFPYLVAQGCMADPLSAAAADYRRLIHDFPDSLEFRLGLADVFIYQNQMDMAESEVRAVLEAAPQNTQALYLRSLVREGRGDIRGAAADVEAVLAIDPNHMHALNARCWRRAVAGERLDDAQRDCERAVNLALADLELLPHDDGTLDNFWDSLALVYLKQRRNEAAEQVYNRMLGSQNPTYQNRARFGLGIVYLRTGQTSDADRAFQRALEGNPNLEAEFAGIGIRR
jgi:hypothetical protein